MTAIYIIFGGAALIAALFTLCVILATKDMVKNSPKKTSNNKNELITDKMNNSDSSLRIQNELKLEIIELKQEIEKLNISINTLNQKKSLRRYLLTIIICMILLIISFLFLITRIV